MLVKTDENHTHVQLLKVPEISRQMVSCAFSKHRQPGITSISFHCVRKALPEQLAQRTPWLGILKISILGADIFITIPTSSC